MTIINATPAPTFKSITDDMWDTLTTQQKDKIRDLIRHDGKNITFTGFSPCVAKGREGQIILHYTSAREDLNGKIYPSGIAMRDRPTADGQKFVPKFKPTPAAAKPGGWKTHGFTLNVSSHGILCKLGMGNAICGDALNYGADGVMLGINGYEVTLTQRSLKALIKELNGLVIKP